MKRLLILAVCLLFSTASRAATYYAATNGLAGNAGTIGSPWNLQTALSKVGIIVGGDTINLRGGSYTNVVQGYVAGGNEGVIFQINISGVYNNPIIIQSFPGEWAMLDGKAFGPPFEYHATSRPTLEMGSSADSTKGRFIHLRNMEIMSSSTAPRYSATPQPNESFPTDFFLSDGIYVHGQSNILENLVVHDVSTGISAWEQSSNTKIHNCVVFNNGWVGVTQLHGHGFYTQNRTNREIKDISYNIILNNYDNSIQAYGSGSAQTYHYRIHHNIVSGNRILVGGRAEQVQGDNQARTNFHYNSDLVWIYFPSSNSVDIVVSDNYIGKGVMQGGYWTTAMVTNNTIVNISGSTLFTYLSRGPAYGGILPGWTFDRNTYRVANVNAANAFNVDGIGFKNFTQWKAFTGWDAASTMTSPLPNTNLMVLQPNLYDANKAQAAIYNWAISNSVALDVSIMGWSTSDSVRVRNAQNYLFDITTNSIPGNVITLNMQASAHTVALPHGGSNITASMNFPQFGSFVLERIVGAAPTPTNTITITSSPTGATIGATTDNNGNGSGVATFARQYLFGSPVTLTAPLTFTTNNFSKWRLNGVDNTSSNVVSFTVATNVTWQAVYVAPPIVTWTLNMSSSNPNSGVVITNSPADNSLLTQGTTPYALTFNDGVVFTLRAPLTSGGNNFQRWDKNGSALSTTNVVTLTANSSTLVSNPSTFAAIYSPPAAPTNALAVTSFNPNSGVPITVTPADANGQSNGNTPFNRIYVTTNTVTLTAPYTAPNGNVWIGWADEGGNIANTNLATTFTMAANHSRQGVYTNPPLQTSVFMTGSENRRRGAR